MNKPASLPPAAPATPTAAPPAPAAPHNFADRFVAAVAAKRNPLCVGLDPRFEQLPAALREEALREHGRSPKAVAAAFLRFNRAVLDAVAPVAPLCKPQIAFYERYGVEGLRAYAETIAHAREQGLLVISDAKRGDIGSTAAAYAPAHLGRPRENAADAELEGGFGADALTVNPYLGRDSLDPFIETAARRGAGLFVLVKTSNPGSRDLQDLRLSVPGKPSADHKNTADSKAADIAPALTLAERVAEMVREAGAALVGESGFSAVGAVVGATHPEEARRLRKLMPKTLFLVPGYGAQGASAAEAVAGFAPGAPGERGGRGATVNSSRGVIFAWRKEPYASKFGEARWQDAVRAAAEDAAAELSAAARLIQPAEAFPGSGPATSPGRR